MANDDNSEEPFYFGEVIGSSRSYHQPNCHIVRQIYGRNYKRLRNWQEAVSLGLNPCPHCNPPFVPTPETKHKPTVRISLSASQLGDFRRGLLRLLDVLDNDQQGAQETLAARIQRLVRAKIIPYPVASCMHTIRAMRNDKEYGARTISHAETDAVFGALAVIEEWARERGLALPDELKRAANGGDLH